MPMNDQVIRLAEVIVAYCIVGTAFIAAVRIAWMLIAMVFAPWGELFGHMWQEFRQPYRPSPWLSRQFRKEEEQ